MKNILVFFGGKSCEHDVSVITGVLTLNSLDKNLFNPIPIYVHGNGEWYSGKQLFDVSFYKNFNAKKLVKVTLLSNENALYVKNKRLKKLLTVDCAINCMHGLNGEDGSLAGLLKLHNIPLASPSVFASSLAIDKEFTKIALKGIAVQKLPYEVLNKKEFDQNSKSKLDNLVSAIGFPMIVKPANLGSSIGINKAENVNELNEAINSAFIYDDKLIIEPKLDNFIELNCSAYKSSNGVKISEVERPVSVNEILTFKDKYEGFKGGSAREFPAKIPEKTAKKIKSITKKVYESFDFSGIIRVDYLLKGDQIFLNEINTVPGSLAYYLFSETLSGFTDILSDIVYLAIKDYENYQSKKFDYASSVLYIDGVKNGKSKFFDNKNR